MVERHLAKVNVARSNRVTRFQKFFKALPVEAIAQPFVPSSASTIATLEKTSRFMVLPQAVSPTRTVLVCQNRTCLKQGSDRVLATLREKSPEGVTMVASQCLGQCGSGPMVRVLPDEVWYDRVSPEEVGAIVDRHLRQNRPVAAMLYAKFHPTK